MRHIDRLRALADRRPGPVRRAFSNVLFQLPSLAIGVCVGGIVGIVFAVSGTPMLLTLAVAVAATVVVARIAAAAWERSAGLSQVPTPAIDEDEDGELDEPGDSDTDVTDAEPARAADSPDMAVAR